jgi:hypothetical protein
MAKALATFGFELASDVVDQHDLDSRTTLLDYDIALFRPTLDGFMRGRLEDYLGKPCLDDTASFQLREACAHWRREIKQAVETGKTVVVFLTEKRNVYIATGEKRHSGTGRNQKTTRIVEPVSNYSMLPVNATFTNAAGSVVKLTDMGARWLAPYWGDFGSSNGYKVQVATEASNPIRIWLTTKGADLAVGGVVEAKKSGGALILLPDLDFEQQEFFEEANEKTVWTDAAHQFAMRLVSSFVAIDKHRRAEGETTPEPSWATLPMFALHAEQSLQSELLMAERRAEDAQAQVNSFKDELANAGHLRALLFEKGKPLENAIIQALTLMGFEAKPYKEGASEFDVVFERDGGRLLGEAEGKDTKAVNIDKLRQLSMNIHEDLCREEVSSPAKGVLFGNSFRLQPPDARAVQFTDKCISAAVRQSTALVATSDLFLVTQYLAEHTDEGYSAGCRDAMLTGNGLGSRDKVLAG